MPVALDDFHDLRAPVEIRAAVALPAAGVGVDADGVVPGLKRAASSLPKQGFISSAISVLLYGSKAADGMRALEDRALDDVADGVAKGYVCLLYPGRIGRRARTRR